MSTSSILTHKSMIGILSGCGYTAKIGCLSFGVVFVFSLVTGFTSFAVTPGYLIPPNFWIWTLLTHQFLETNILLFACGILSLVVNSSVLEKDWGSLKLVLYYGIVSVLSAFVCTVMYISIYMVTFNTDYLFHVHIYGAGGLVGGGMVALRQVHGDMALTSTIGLQVRHLTLACMVVLSLLTVTDLVRTSYVLAYTTGALVGWIYLRYYQLHKSGRGDQTETFSFKYFFPGIVQQPVGIASQILYNFLVKVHVCRKTVYRYDVGAPSDITISLSGVDALDVERRRKKAIKALDERLKKSMSGSSETVWPTLQDECHSCSESPQKLIQNAHAASVTDNHASSEDGSASPDIVTIDVETPGEMPPPGSV